MTNPIKDVIESLRTRIENALVRPWENISGMHTWRSAQKHKKISKQLGKRRADRKKHCVFTKLIRVKEIGIRKQRKKSDHRRVRGQPHNFPGLRFLNQFRQPKTWTTKMGSEKNQSTGNSSKHRPMLLLNKQTHWHPNGKQALSHTNARLTQSDFSITISDPSILETFEGLARKKDMHVPTPITALCVRAHVCSTFVKAPGASISECIGKLMPLDQFRIVVLLA